MKSPASSFTLEPLLLRQMTRAGAALENPPETEAWTKLLRSVNDHYRHMEQDRSLLTRSMEISTGELEELRRRVERQRDQLRIAMVAVSDALHMFDGLASAGDNLDPAAIARAKEQFSVRLADAFAADGHDDDTTAEFSGIRANLVRLAEQLIRLLTDTAAKAAMDRELAVARTVQQLLVPSAETVIGSVLRVASHFQPAAECGGDWWGFYQLPRGRELVVVGDVTGHGIASAIMTGVAKAACEIACHTLGGELTAGQLLGLMNVAFCKSAQHRIMMSCCAALFDQAAGTVFFANAGHPFPYLLRNGLLKTLTILGEPLGASLDTEYETMGIPFRQNDLFVWFTDGVAERENEAGEQFSERRLRAACQRGLEGGVTGVRDAIVQSLNEFAGRKSADDDITLVAGSVV
jgi:sigma-B regulation protein RsbU (phosphoserine phosphatase)